MNNNLFAGILVAILFLFAGEWYLAAHQGVSVDTGTASSEGRGGDSNFDSVVLDTTLTVGATTTFGGTSGTIGYYSVGGFDFAAMTQSLTSSSSVPSVIRNPWGTTSATTSIDEIFCNLTSNPYGATTWDISTTSNALGYGSSTVALVKAYSIGSGAIDSIIWKPMGTSTGANPTQVLMGSLTSGASAFRLLSGESITLRNATATPGTFGTYAAGTCSGLFSRP